MYFNVFSAPDPGNGRFFERRVEEQSLHGESASVFVWNVFIFLFIFDIALMVCLMMLAR